MDPSNFSRGELVEFIKTKIVAAERTLKSREEMERVWREGTDESWRAVGCKKTRAQRLKVSEMHGRIAARNRKEVELFKGVLMELQK